MYSVAITSDFNTSHPIIEPSAYPHITATNPNPNSLNDNYLVQKVNKKTDTTNIIISKTETRRSGERNRIELPARKQSRSLIGCNSGNNILLLYSRPHNYLNLHMFMTETSQKVIVTVWTFIQCY